MQFEYKFPSNTGAKLDVKLCFNRIGEIITAQKALAKFGPHDTEDEAWHTAELINDLGNAHSRVGRGYPVESVEYRGDDVISIEDALYMLGHQEGAGLQESEAYFCAHALDMINTARSVTIPSQRSASEA